tara:strand:- start:2704 stop:3510 length:807 start_codon:yes stop_codon:yes gene_type:complete
METGKANRIQSETFNIDLSEEYNISIQIGLKSLSYYIINNNTRDIEHVKKLQIHNNLANIINTDDILKLDFLKSKIIFTNFPCTLIPKELFLEKQSKELLELTSDTYEVIQSDFIEQIDAYLVYSIPKDISNTIFTFFPKAKQKAQQAILIEQFSNINSNDSNAYLHISENTLNITIFKTNKLIFNNSFSVESKEDLLYFTLFTFEQLKIDPEKINVRLYGDILYGDQNYKLLYEYIREIKFGEKPGDLNISGKLKELKGHQLYGLFN